MQKSGYRLSLTKKKIMMYNVKVKVFVKRNMCLLFYQTKSNSRFVFKQRNPDATGGREIPSEKSTPLETSFAYIAPGKLAEEAEKRAKKIIGRSIIICNPNSSKIESPKNEWQKETNAILAKFRNADPHIVEKFNGVMKEYAARFGMDIDTNKGPFDSFYDAIKISGTPDTQKGYITAWKDILSVAKKTDKTGNLKKLLKGIIDEAKQEYARQKAGKKK